MGDMVKGNIAMAEAAMRAGVVVYAGYPITPSTEVMEYLSGRMPELGRTFIQAESELAAINMVLGVGACGRRVLTASSGPGSCAPCSPRGAGWGPASRRRLRAALRARAVSQLFQLPRAGSKPPMPSQTRISTSERQSSLSRSSGRMGETT